MVLPMITILRKIDYIWWFKDAYRKLNSTSTWNASGNSLKSIELVCSGLWNVGTLQILSIQTMTLHVSLPGKTSHKLSHNESINFSILSQQKQCQSKCDSKSLQQI